MTPFLLTGLLRDVALRRAVLGMDCPVEASAEGLQVSLEEAPAARLKAWAEARGLSACAGPGGVTALGTGVADWPIAFERALAEAILSLWPEHSAADLKARLPQIAARVQARLNARADQAPTSLRHRAATGDVQITAHRHPYARFFSVEEFELTHATFDGGTSDPLLRAVFVSGDAVVVLPYDPHRDRVLLVEQFRSGPLARGDLQPWSLEAIAGRIDPGESPEDAARREAIEEAGLRFGELHTLGGTYPSPGAVAEYLYNFIALADLPEDLARRGGLAEEGEDIRLHLMSFAEMMALIESGEINNGPLILIALMLGQRRAGLRAAAG